MHAQEFKGKLMAIMSLNAVGYSRVMREDEEATVWAQIHQAKPALSMMSPTTFSAPKYWWAISKAALQLRP
jgi:hypothetical protein